MKTIISFLTLVFLALLIGCQKNYESAAPNASFDVKPTSGTTRTYFSIQIPEEYLHSYQLQFDLNNNGKFDHIINYYDYSYESLRYIQFPKVGSNIVKMRAVDHNLLVSESSKTINISEYNINYGQFTDPRDNTTYKTVQIGNQTWFAENLRYEPGSVPNGNYGRLYSYSAALTACPTGWHLPSKEEFETLVNYINTAYGGSGWGQDAGIQLKKDNSWGPGDKANNETGFSALPGGYHNPSIYFDYEQQGELGLFYSSSFLNWGSGFPYRLELSKNDNYARIIANYYGQGIRFSVRCIKD